MKETSIKEKFLERRAQGFSYEKIATELNVSKQTLINWSREFQHELKNLGAIELESLQSQYQLHKRNRIELLGNLFRKVRQEIENRNFNDISTEKLIDIQSKLLASIKEELGTLEFEKKLSVSEKFSDGFGELTNWPA